MNKTKNYSLAMLLLLSVTVFTACDSAAKKEEEAKENVQDATQNLKEVQQEVKADAVKEANAEEWAAYRTETEARITTNEARIAELRIKLKKPGKVLDPIYTTRIEELKTKNDELRTRLANYPTAKTDWEKFKAEYNRDMDALGVALKDFSVDNKK